tara:strand:- start:2171 stop:2395 length:225 start_codon:yes stop_codon:yes gene_type:complete
VQISSIEIWVDEVKFKFALERAAKGGFKAVKFMAAEVYSQYFLGLFFRLSFVSIRDTMKRIGFSLKCLEVKAFF